MVLTTTDYSAPRTLTFTGRVVAALDSRLNAVVTVLVATLTMDAHAAEIFKATLKKASAEASVVCWAVTTVKCIMMDCAIRVVAMTIMDLRLCAGRSRAS